MQVNANRDAPKRNAHATKSGPGRRHVQGEKHGSAPKPMTGAFAGQRTNPERAKRRAFIKACGGIRQFKRINRLHLSA